MIPAEAVEAAAKYLAEKFNWNGELLPETARAALEAAAPYMLSHEREQTRLAHLDAMVNRETKREELAHAWDQGYKAAMFDKEYYSYNQNPYRAERGGE